MLDLQQPALVSMRYRKEGCRWALLLLLLLVVMQQQLLVVAALLLLHRRDGTSPLLLQRTQTPATRARAFE